MRMKQLEAAVDMFIENPELGTLAISSSPGLGKTECIYSRAAAHDMPCYVMHTSMMDPTAIMGYPVSVIQDGFKVMEFARPDWLRQKKPFVMFLDEFDKAPVAVKNTCAPLILEQRVDGIPLPKGSSMFVAMNRAEDRTGSAALPTHLPNRWTEVGLEFHLDDFRAHGLKKGWGTELLSFASFRPGLMNDFSPKRSQNATPRQWERVNRMLSQLTKDIELEMISGTVGEGAAGEFIAFLRTYRDLAIKFNPDSILLAPDKFDVPTDPATMYALAGALSHKANKNNVERFFKYVGRWKSEFQVLAVRDMATRDPILTACRPFIEWTQTNANVIL